MGAERLPDLLMMCLYFYVNISETFARYSFVRDARQACIIGERQVYSLRELLVGYAFEQFYELLTFFGWSILWTRCIGVRVK